MKTDAVGAGIGATAVLLNDVSVVLFGAPISLVVACFGGAIFGATHFKSESKGSRPWVVLVNTVAGVVLGAVVARLGSLDGAVLSGLGFVISAAPVLFVRWIQGRVTGKEQSNAPPA